jgi:hypothetical protein
MSSGEESLGASGVGSLASRAETIAVGDSRPSAEIVSSARSAVGSQEADIANWRLDWRALGSRSSDGGISDVGNRTSATACCGIGTAQGAGTVAPVALNGCAATAGRFAGANVGRGDGVGERADFLFHLRATSRGSEANIRHTLADERGQTESCIQSLKMGKKFKLKYQHL